MSEGPLRIQVVSDLHVDVAPAELCLAPGADVLVVAGHTCEGVDRGFAWLRSRRFDEDGYRAGRGAAGGEGTQC